MERRNGLSSGGLSNLPQTSQMHQQQPAIGNLKLNGKLLQNAHYQTIASYDGFKVAPHPPTYAGNQAGGAERGSTTERA